MKIFIEAELSPQQIHEIAKEVAKIMAPKTETKSSNSDSLELLTVKQACKLARVSEQTIRRHIEIKILPAKKIGKAFRINREDLNTYLHG